MGSVLISARTDWVCLDSLIAKTFKVSHCPFPLHPEGKGWIVHFALFFNVCQDYLTQVDPTASLGLSCDSLHAYQLTQGGQRVMGGEVPQAAPHRCLGASSPRIFVSLKGQ